MAFLYVELIFSGTKRECQSPIIVPCWLIRKQHPINSYGCNLPQIFDIVTGCPHFFHLSGKPIRASSRPEFSRRARSKSQNAGHTCAKSGYDGFKG